MMFEWRQSAGELWHDGVKIASGYSGALGESQNNPLHQAEVNVGPIPRGEWKIVGPPMDTSNKGPYVLRLTPKAETESFGRHGFLIHGDSIVAPGSASQGCIILPRYIREHIWNTGDRDLVVVA